MLLLIFAQDIKHRAVYWFLFPGLMVSFLALQFLQGSRPAGIWQPALVNVVFLLIQLVVVSAYFSVKNKKWINITDGLLGWGDILFLFSLCFYLSVLNFLFFFVASLVLVIVIWLIWRVTTKHPDKHVPLAGLQSLICAVFLAASWWGWGLNLTNDNWLLQILYK
jgi:hypothetical protein